ncbi:MAG: hypothetical protein ACC661_03420, partial [Verrucomicrobiales bacterium]
MPGSPPRLHARESFRFEASLDPFVTLPSAWKITPDQLEGFFDNENMDKNPHFKWLTKNRSRALFQRHPFSNVTVDLTLFGGEVPVEEATIDFKDGTFLGMTVSIYNRGDGGEIDQAEFERRRKITGREIGAQLDIRPFRREAKPAQGMLTQGWIWVSAAGMAVLESNPEAEKGRIEFLRLRLARRDAKGAYAAAMQNRAGATVKLSDLPKNVVRDGDGNVYVKNVPMVDQGQKGYCVVASTQRLFEYYGIACDQHQLAQISGADPERGTNTLSITNELGAIDHLFKTRFTALAISHRGNLHELVGKNIVGDEVDERKF